MDKNIHKYSFICYYLDFPTNVSYIHIRNATLDTFNVSEVKWRRLKSLAITDGKINRIKGQFLMMTPTHCLNLSNNAMVDIENNSFTRLAQLTSLDISYNNITHLPALNTMNGREFWLDISGKSSSNLIVNLKYHLQIFNIRFVMQELIHYGVMMFINI